MSTLTSELSTGLPASATPTPSEVDTTASFRWIHKGVEDFISAPFLSLL